MCGDFLPSFEEEAFARAAQLHRKDDKHGEAHRPPPVKPKPADPESPKPQPKPKPVAPNLMETLFRDKDKSLILLLLMLLMDEDKDPSLLFALAYLLM